jgi:hypothetical protein
MSREFTLLLAVHNHQPVGNFARVFAKAFGECYRPFLEEIRKHPSVKWTIHYSGPLWEYMDGHEKESWEIVREISASGQVELLTGGFYEPILTVIPEEDRQGQIMMMSQFLEENFGCRPRGIWLTERVWEPTLPKTLAKTGIEYTLLDEEHFHYAGVRNLHEYYITEDEGRPLRVFPIDKKLRYLIPFRDIKEIRTYFRAIREQNGLAILGDDGEKFGLWPGTHARVYTEGWLSRFLNYIEEEHIRTATYSEILDSRPAAGRVYLPPASYEEMMEWVLEPEEAESFETLKKKLGPEARRFLRGGFFRDFFLKYREAHHLHKRMIAVSRSATSAGREEAKKELYKAQSNDAYWHGVFGGLYLPHLRESAFLHLFRAEKTLPRERDWKKEDYDLDGENEYHWRGDVFGLLAKPSLGGSLVEIAYYPLFRNLLDVLSRRKESYHEQRLDSPGEGKSIHELPKHLPDGAEKLFHYDWHPRYSALIHFLHPDTTLENFASIAYGEQGDFIDQPYRAELRGSILSVRRSGQVWIEDEPFPLSVEKEFMPDDRKILVRITVKSLSPRRLSLVLGNEWNVFQTPDECRIDGGKIFLCDDRLELDVQPEPIFWHFPLRTLSQSEEGYDIIHQGFCFLSLWKIVLAGGEEFRTEIRLRETRGA